MHVENKEAWYSNKNILCIVGIFALVVAEFFLKKLGWFLLPAVALIAIPTWRRIQGIQAPEHFIRIKSIKPKRDSWR